MITLIYSCYQVTPDFRGWFLNQDGSLDTMSGENQTRFNVCDTVHICQGDPPVSFTNGYAYNADGSLAFRVHESQLFHTVPIIINGTRYWVDPDNLPLAL